MGYRCLFCYTDLKDDRVVVKRENIDLKHSSSPVLEQQVKVIFILRKLLEIPEEKLISFLGDWGNNPSEWIRLCQQCEESVENARKIYGEILEVQRRFKGVQQRIIEVTNRSCYGDGGGGRERTGRHGRRAISKDYILAVTNECRTIIQQRTDQCSFLVDNPFIEGDFMAETAVIAGQRTGSNVDDITVPVKEEVIFEDQSESSLPSNHFDHFVTDVLTEVEMNYEDDEDNDDEWVPDPLESISPKTKSPKSSSPRSKVSTKLKRKFRSTSGHAKVECPVCQNFKCKVDNGEELCEHLEFCTKKFGNQDEDCHLKCPVCRKFTIDIGNKVEFSEHMSWCAAINQSSGAEMEDIESSPLRWKVFSCDTCGEKGNTKFMKIDQFVDHLFHHMRCPFKCTRCPQRFKVGASQYNFYHFKVNHPNFLQPASSRCVFDGDLPNFHWWCPVSKCSKKFTTHNLRDEHIQFEHADSSQAIQSRKSIICGMCSSAFFCADELRLHNATNHVFMEQEQERDERSVQNQLQQKQNPKHEDIIATIPKRRRPPRNRKAIKRKSSSTSSSSSASDSPAMSEEDEEGARSNANSSRQSHKPTNTEQGYSRKEFLEILKIVRGEKERKSHTQSIMFCPHCNEFPFKVHQLALVLDHMETCRAATDKSDNSFEMKKCPVCLVKKIPLESSPVEYVEHVASCNKQDANDRDGICLIPLENRLFNCTTCSEDEKKWMQVDDFLEHYIYHLRYRFKCTKCSHRFVTDNSQDTHYHYKTVHPENLKDPTYIRCALDNGLPELCWWCPVCSLKFCDDDDRNIHFDQHHLAEYSDLQANKDKHVCQWCSKAYFCADELRYHKGTRHVYDERKRTGRSAPKYERPPRKSPGQKPRPNEPTRPKPKRSYADTRYSTPSTSMRPTISTTKPVVTLSSSEFFTKLQFRQFLRTHLRKLNETETSHQNNNRLFQCNICPDKEVMDLAAFLEHYLFHKRKIFKCTKCSHRFPSNEGQDTTYHYKTNHPDHWKEPPITRCVEDAVLPELVWMCFYCQEEYSSEHLRNNHVETQHQDKLSEQKSKQCQFCSKKYSSSEELLIHIGTTHVIVEKFRKHRLLPSSDFYTKLQFKQIVRKHFAQEDDGELSKSKDSRLFLCNICPDKEVMDLAAFLDHYLFHKRNIFKCTKCSHRFPSNEGQDTTYHYKTNHPDHWKEPPITRCVEDAVLPELVWMCLYCQEEYSSEHLRDTHVETEHQDKLSEEKLQLCQLCSKKYSSSEELLIHIGTTHVLVEKARNDTRYKCNECLETFEKWGDYENHSRKEHHKVESIDKSDEKESQGNPVQALYVVCEICGKQVKHTYLKEHLMKHKRTKKIHCQVPGCGESFKTNEYLNLHKFRKHESRDPGKNPLVCPYCPVEKVVHNRAYLRKHIQAIHHKKFDKQCHLCGRGFVFKTQLSVHMSRAHQIETKGQLKCPVEGCGKIFYWKGSLQEHLSKHKGEPKFKCQICGKEFYFKNHFRRHEQIHKNAESKPYQCEICAKRFPVRNYLYIHMRSHKRKGEL